VTIAWPTDLLPGKCTFFLEHNTAIFVSPITGSHPALSRSGARWNCAIEINPAPRAKAQRIDALLAKLKGAYNTVALWDFARPDPAGDNRDRGLIADTRFTDGTTFTDGTVFDGGAAGVTVWGGWDAGATMILTDGWWQSITGALLAGDYIGIGGFLYMLTDDLVSDSMGRAYLSIAPPLNADVAHLAVVTRSMPTTSFRLVDDGQPNRQSMPDGYYTYSLALTEAL
jgi:hypothetical protein